MKPERTPCEIVLCRDDFKDGTLFDYFCHGLLCIPEDTEVDRIRVHVEEYEIE